MTIDPAQLEKLSSQATLHALKGNWEAAAKLNREIVRIDPKNIDSLNRLGHAYTEMGMITEAMAIYRKVLRIDSYNGIAAKNLKRLKAVRGKCKAKKQSLARSKTISPLTDNLFLEVPGKTATVHLVDLAEPRVLAMVNCAEHLLIKPKKHQVAVTTDDGIYLGKLPDNLAVRLIRLITGGNRYEIYVKGVSDDQLKVFLREVKRVRRFASVHSFPIDDKMLYVAFTPPEMVHGEVPESRSLEEQGESEGEESSDESEE